MFKSFRVEYTSQSMPDVSIDIDNQKKYGVLSLQVDDNIILDESPILFHIMLDVSGSMSDYVSHNRTKMQLLKHTITNMLYYFAENTNNVYIDIKGFDDRIHNYIDSTLVTKLNVNDLLDKLHLMRPMNSTDIGLALDTLKQNMEVTDDIEKRHVGILLTDGHPTSGCLEIDELTQDVLQDKSYHFIALGDEHNAQLMNALGHSHSRTNNWFINEIEHTGNVYGEIIFNETNLVFENNVICVENGTIYDYRKGTFVNQLEIGNLSKETTKEYHMLVDNIDECEIFIEGIYSKGGDSFKILAGKSVQNSLIKDELPNHVLFKNLMALDDSNSTFITKHYFRLCVQKMLFSIRKDLEKSLTIDMHCFRMPIPPPRLKKVNKELYDNVRDLKKKIIDFSEKKNIEKDEFIIGLLNDLNVVINSDGSDDQYKHISAREDTQGKQTAFNTSSQMEDDPDNFTPIERPKLVRGSTSAYLTPSRAKLMREFSTDIDDILSPTYPASP
jgi:hypothetical protein